MNSKKNKSKKNRTVKCAPKSSNNKFSCYSGNILSKLKKDWNKTKKSYIKSNDPKQIWKSLNKKYKNCKRESCWVKKSNLNKSEKLNILTSTFAPPSPIEWGNNPNTWLSNWDIKNVLSQYEKVYNDFKSFDPSPIDYDNKLSFNQCVSEELCKFNLKFYKDKNINKIAAVFNLDKHNQPGSHWVVLYIDIFNKQIYYFDSVGDKIPHKINNFKNDITKQGLLLNIKFKFNQLWPKIQHQKKNTECGMYVLYFVIKMIKGEKWSYFLKNKITDEEVEKCRKIYFNEKL
jgi:hypothetical protein